MVVTDAEIRVSTGSGARNSEQSIGIKSVNEYTFKTRLIYLLRPTEFHLSVGISEVIPASSRSATYCEK